MLAFILRRLIQAVMVMVTVAFIAFMPPLLLKGALLVLCVGSVVWLNRQAVAPANAVGVAA
jgi:alkylglycerol monooxygenase